MIIPFLNEINYTGRYINHAEALTTCQQTLVTSVDPDRRNVILLITDGVLSRLEIDPFGEAQSAATLVKNERRHNHSVFIEGQNQQQLNYMRSLSNDGEVSEGTSFGELFSLFQDLQTKLLCENKLRSIQPSFSSVPSINPASPITSTQPWQRMKENTSVPLLSMVKINSFI